MGDDAWTYAELDGAANRVAHALLERRGVDTRPIVLLVEQSGALVAGILGVLKSGAPYVPLETTYAPAHVAAVLEEAQAVLVLADAAGATLADAVARASDVLRVDRILDGDGPEDRPGLVVRPDAFASIYYTSGSTGRPKGVVDSHRNVLHNVMRYTNSLGIDRDDRVTLVQSPGFSGAVSSLFGALLNGAAIFPYDLRRQGVAGLGPWLVREHLTIYHSVPALFRLAATGADSFPDLRLIRLEGDQMSRRDWVLFRERFEDGCLLVNGLGATECGLVRQFVIQRTMPPAAGVVPVGYPVEDMEVRVLDEAGQPVAIGEVGEIAVQSRYLAVGYWGRPDLTVHAFTSDSEEPDLRTYRTGDLGRLGPDGRLDHLGRRDARQKIRGQWVDLAEVEAVLLSATGVREAAARVHAPESDDPRLVGYVVPHDTPRPTVSTLRRHLAASLSDAMVPTTFVMLDRLPLTDNGKLDRAALPPPSPGRPRLDAEFVAPRTRLEHLLADVWAEVLSVDQVGVHDAFLDLGGDSLRVGRVHARLQDRLGIVVPVSALLEHATIAALARALDPGDAPPDPLATLPARAKQQIAAAARFRSKKRRR